MKSNEPQKVLRDIYKNHGPSILDDPQRIKGFLSDLCSSHKREINLLMAALAEKIPQALINARSIPVEVLSEQFIKKLHDHHGISSEFAKWTIDAWRSALDLRSDPQLLQANNATINKAPFVTNREFADKPNNKVTINDVKKCPHCSKENVVVKGVSINNTKCRHCNRYLDLKRHCEAGNYIKNDWRIRGYKFEKFGKLPFGAIFYLPDGSSLTKMSVRLASDNTNDYQMKSEDLVIIHST